MGKELEDWGLEEGGISWGREGVLGRGGGNDVLTTDVNII